MDSYASYSSFKTLNKSIRSRMECAIIEILIYVRRRLTDCFSVAICWVSPFPLEWISRRSNEDTDCSCLIGSNQFLNIRQLRFQRRRANFDMIDKGGGGRGGGRRGWHDSGVWSLSGGWIAHPRYGDRSWIGADTRVTDSPVCQSMTSVVKIRHTTLQQYSEHEVIVGDWREALGWSHES